MDSVNNPEDVMECEDTDIADGAGKSVGISVNIDLSKDEVFNNTDHRIDGKIVFPDMGYLILAWKAFAKIRNEDHEKLTVVMEEIRFNKLAEIPENHSMKFVVNIIENTGDFVVSVEGCSTATGKIRIQNNVELDELYLPVPEPKSNDSEYVELTSNDVYKVLNSRGYDYNGIFKAIRSSDNRSLIGAIDWHGNWISFIDTIFQFKLLSINTNDLLSPTKISYAAIKPAMHAKFVANIETTDQGIPVYSYPAINIIKSGGIELRGIETSSVAKRTQIPQPPPIHERYSFVSYENSPIPWSYLREEDSQPAYSVSLTAFVQIVIENIGSSKIKAVEIAGERRAEFLLAPLIVDIVQSEPNMTINMEIISKTPHDYRALAEEFDFKILARDVNKNPAGTNLDLIVAANILTNKHSMILENLEVSLRPGGFMILEEILINSDIAPFWNKMLRGSKFLVIGKRYIRGKVYILLKYKERTVRTRTIWIDSTNFSWLKDLQTALKSSVEENQKILLVSENKISGLIGFVNCLRREFPNVNVSYVYVEDTCSTKFSLTGYADQLENQLTANVFKDGKWGSYRYLSLSRHGPIRIKPFYFVTDMTIEQLINYAWTRIFTYDNHQLMKLDTNKRHEENYSNGEQKNFLPNFCIGPFRRKELRLLRKKNKLLKTTMMNKQRASVPTQRLNSLSPVENNFQNWELVYCSLNLRYVLAKKTFPTAMPDSTNGSYVMINDAFSGRDHIGQRVMGLLITRLRIDRDWQAEVEKNVRRMKIGLAWEVPENWSLEEAATVPFSYAMAYRCLVVQGHLKPGNSVLVHNGTEPISQACIAIALHADCNVFTTVNSMMKIEFLKKNFPKLELKNIFLGGPEEETYVNNVLAETRGMGVDIVVHSLMKHKISDGDAGTPPLRPRCLSRLGSFIEAKSFEISKLSGGIEDTVAFPPEMEKIIELVNEGIKSGVVRPLSSCVFNESNIEDAYNFINSDTNIGNALLNLRDGEYRNPNVEIVNGVSRIRMSPYKSYILIGDLEDFDLEFIEWIITRGAKYIVIVTASIRTGYQSLKIRRWREAGIEVTVSTGDVSFELQVQQLLTDTKKIAPIGGIFYLGSIYRDESMEHQSEKDFGFVVSSKVDGTKYLDIASRKLCPDLDYFVIFSSTVSGRGRHGQSNIGFANSMIERIIEKRNEIGYPATVIQWEPELCQTSARMNGTIAQSTSSCLETLDFFLQQPVPILSSVVLAQK